MESETLAVLELKKITVKICPECKKKYSVTTKRCPDCDLRLGEETLVAEIKIGGLPKPEVIVSQPELWHRVSNVLRRCAYALDVKGE